jgi:hypothetical protein
MAVVQHHHGDGEGDDQGVNQLEEADKHTADECPFNHSILLFYSIDFKFIRKPTKKIPTILQNGWDFFNFL